MWKTLGDEKPLDGQSILILQDGDVVTPARFYSDKGCLYYDEDADLLVYNCNIYAWTPDGNGAELYPDNDEMFPDNYECMLWQPFPEYPNTKEK